MPIGVDGTARFVQDVSEEAGSRTSEVVRARSAWEDLGALRNRIRGKRIFFAGDTGFEIPLARFLADAGAVVLEVGAPRLDRRFLAAELQALGPDVDVVVSPDYRGQANRIDEARPDVVVCSPGLHLPLVARGHLCRSTQDFLRAGLYGYGGASHPGAPGAHPQTSRDPGLAEPVRLVRGVYEDRRATASCAPRPASGAYTRVQGATGRGLLPGSTGPASGRGSWHQSRSALCAEQPGTRWRLGTSPATSGSSGVTPGRGS